MVNVGQNYSLESLFFVRLYHEQGKIGRLTVRLSGGGSQVNVFIV